MRKSDSTFTTPKPSIGHQIRLNPAMKEVVRAEVLKLLNAGIIYTILDSS